MAGMIGTGKSTYAEFLSEQLNSEIFYESVVDNPILPDYYKNPKRWAFPLQIYFLNTRFKTIRQARTSPDNVLDRSLYEDLIFAELNFDSGNMTQLEFDTYKDLLETMMNEIDKTPKSRQDLLIYLDSDLDTVLNRIKQRGRSYEQVEEHPELFTYYKTLHTKYKEWIKAYDKTPVLMIESDQYDIFDKNDQDKIMTLVRNELNRLESVHSRSAVMHEIR
ncbi:deoxynucleoside kinase [Fictibacillus phosphorivorans]|uniref:deoxynucleoside kinase n=1 Tax=Fictibacillus phosphorivorans TaxID=1221500 RepID=UPI002041E7E0|nr:deoxynucleoside kinase [Fictibacillus phosphorivorans]MCM3718611.1 deoxynucleoside kinase [Fictibacillus phosphorivorans]MCM3776234.1 deoxynucleoside kinase [Fictibacillus phosphorivorans]